MCTVCGCSDQQGATLPPPTLHFGKGAAGVSLPGLSQARTITLETNILSANNQIAGQNRAYFKSHRIRALNLLSSPGSGKTTLLCKTLEVLKKVAPALKTSVIEGDQQTSLDAERIQTTGVPVVQVNTGKGCHLDARMVAEATSRLPLHGHNPSAVIAKPHKSTISLNTLTSLQPIREHLLFIENVGNLVCPALWDLGEDAKVVILSVTEGEDKPLKYPDMFDKADLLLINKIDLLPHVDFDPKRALKWARSIHPSLDAIEISATTGEGMSDWLDWLLKKRNAAQSPRKDQTGLLDRIAMLEAELAAARATLQESA